jgi:hypothetical protein
MDRYTLRSTSANSAEVLEDVILDSTTITRRVFRAMIVNAQDGTPSVRGYIIHQRKKATDDWEDISDEKLSQMKAGDSIKYELGSTAVSRLFEGLEKLRALAAQQGVQFGLHSVAVVDPDSVVEIVNANYRKVIQTLIDKEYGDDFWSALVEADPDLTAELAHARIQKSRLASLKEFEDKLNEGKWSEPEWEQFFFESQWIFGYGLEYRFLGLIKRQGHFGGTNLSGKGAQRGEFLLGSQATKRFTILVEIKKPQTQLFKDGVYRSGVPEFSAELVQGISQAQVNARTWDHDGSKTEQNTEDLHGDSIYTINPDAILVIGHTDQLRTVDQRTSFTLLRSNMRSPVIITFDELLERARHIVLAESSGKDKCS